MSQAALKNSASVPDQFLEFTITGNYHNSKKEIVDFQDVVGKIPFCDEEENQIGSMHVRGRYAEKWVREAVNKDGTKKYPERIHKMRQVFIDDVKLTTGKLSYVGKDIKELSIDEMQELAVAKDLRGVPLPNSGMSKRDMLIRTYVAYADRVLLKKIKYQEEGFNFAKLPSIILDGKSRKETSKKLTNEEVIAREQQPTLTGLGEKDDPRKRFSLDELKEIAGQKGLVYDTDKEGEALFDDLYKELFGNK